MPRPDHDVSGMAPPSRRMRAQRSRIAVNKSNMAALIFKNICRPWRTISYGLKQPPAHGLHLRTLPSASKRMGAKAEIQIVGQRANGEEYGIGLE